jgi:hypothetical protein
MAETQQIWIPSEEEYSAFVTRYSAGKRRIRWVNKPMKLTTEDPAWVAKACEAVRKLSRHDLCTLYTYTTQEYVTITSFLRHRGKKDDFDTEFVHKWENEWYNADSMRILVASLSNNKHSCYLDRKVDEKLAVAFKEAWMLPQATKQQSYRKWKLVDRLYSELRPHFTKRFLKLSHKKTVELNRGLLLFPQALRVYQKQPNVFPKEAGKLQSLADFKKAIPYMTNRTWIHVLEQYVEDMDAIMKKMPPTECAMTVFRGTAEKKAADPSYLSTTLSKAIARNFVSRDTQKCCVYRIEIPVGSHMLPIFCASRYWVEQEILLPRGCKYVMSRVA